MSACACRYSVTMASRHSLHAPWAGLRAFAVAIERGGELVALLELGAFVQRSFNGEVEIG
jgi:hypothetical protein